METLCKSCLHVREVISGTGSKFLLCRLSQTDTRFPKYPPQPVVRCDGYQDRRIASPRHALDVMTGTFAICRLAPDADVPNWATGEVVSVTRTQDELSIVCSQAGVPAGIRREAGWRCLRIVGQLDFSQVGVIASLTGTLADARISVLVMGTFDTDYVLVKDADLESAIVALRAAGHVVRTEENK